MSLCIDENDNRSVYSSIENKLARDTSRGQWLDYEASDSEIEDLKLGEKLRGDGSDEDDSLLVLFQEPASTN